MAREQTADPSVGGAEERGRSVDRQALLLEVGLALSSELSLPAVLQRIVDLATLVTNARYGALGVLDEHDDRIVQFVTSGLTDEQRAAIGPLPVGDGIIGVLIHDPRPLRLRKISDDPRSVGFPPNHPPMNSFLGAPVKGRNRVFGNIYLTEKQGAAEFSESDEHALVILASQAGIAVENARLYEESRRREGVLEAVREITNLILEGALTDEVLRIVAVRARELAGADLATIALPEGDRSLLIHVADGAASADYIGQRFPLEGSISGTLINGGTREVIEDARYDARLVQPLVEAGDIGPAMFVPLSAGRDVFGTLAIARRVGAPRFLRGDVDLVDTFARQASIALEYGRIQDENRRLSLVTDRERIAKELHDGAIQSLFAVGMSLQGTAALVGDPRLARERIDKAVTELDAVIRDLRSYIFELRPSVLAGRDLHDALRLLVAEVEERSDIVLVMEIDPQVSELLAAQSADVVQLVREALSNVVRHANAKTCRVTLQRAAGCAVLVIDDDGSGFDVAPAAGRGSGLRNLRERARSLAGEVDITSTPGEGTTLTIRVPLDA